MTNSLTKTLSRGVSLFVRISRTTDRRPAMKVLLQFSLLLLFNLGAGAIEGAYLYKCQQPLQPRNCRFMKNSHRYDHNLLITTKLVQGGPSSPHHHRCRMCVHVTYNVKHVSLQSNGVIRAIILATGGCWQMQEAPTWCPLMWHCHPAWWVPCCVLLCL